MNEARAVKGFGWPSSVQPLLRDCGVHAQGRPVEIRDGTTICVRHADEDDVEGLLQFFKALSAESLYYRFHGHAALTDKTIRALIGLDASPVATLVAESGGRIVAFASYHRRREAAERAEIAFAVADAFQGHGIGTCLLEQLAAIARAAGISTFEADVLGENAQMLEVFRNSGLAETVRFQGGVFRITLSLGPGTP